MLGVPPERAGELATFSCGTGRQQRRHRPARARPAPPERRPRPAILLATLPVNHRRARLSLADRTSVSAEPAAPPTAGALGALIGWRGQRRGQRLSIIAGRGVGVASSEPSSSGTPERSAAFPGAPPEPAPGRKAGSGGAAMAAPGAPGPGPVPAPSTVLMAARAELAAPCRLLPAAPGGAALRLQLSVQPGGDGRRRFRLGLRLAETGGGAVRGRGGGGGGEGVGEGAGPIPGLSRVSPQGRGQGGAQGTLR